MALRACAADEETHHYCMRPHSQTYRQGKEGFLAIVRFLSLLPSLLPGSSACAGNGYLANVAPSEFAGVYEEELPVSISGKEWLAEHDEHWDRATEVPLMQIIVIKDWSMVWSCLTAEFKEER